MNSGYVQIEVCYKHRNSHISGMRNEFVTFCFLFFVQAVRIRQPFLPPAPREIPKGSCIVYVVVHTSGMRKKTDEFLLCLGGLLGGMYGPGL